MRYVFHFIIDIIVLPLILIFVYKTTGVYGTIITSSVLISIYSTGVSMKRDMLEERVAWLEEMQETPGPRVYGDW